MITDAHREQAKTELAKFTPAQQAGLLLGIITEFYANMNNPAALANLAYETTTVIELGKLGA